MRRLLNVKLIGLLVIATCLLTITGSVLAAKEDFDLNQFKRANINWQQFKGSKLHVMLNQHWYVDAMKEFKLVEQFEKLTGIDVTVDIYPEDAYWTKLAVVLSAGNITPDVFMVGSKDLGQYAAAGWMEPLQPYLNNPKLTDKNWYDLDDIIPSTIVGGSYNGKFYGMPITTEAEILFYRKDAFEKNGIAVPKTFDELYDTALKLKSPNMSGYITRGARGLHIFWEWAGFLLSYGGEFFDKDGKAAFNSQEGIKATEMYVKLLRDAGPKGVANYTWMEGVADFQQGKSAMYVEASGVMPNFENPEKSKIAGKVGYAVLPCVPGRPVRPNYWYWMLGMNSNSKNKNAAYLFLQFLTSKSASHQVAMYGASSARASVWNDKDFQKNYNADWAKATVRSLELVKADAVPYHLKEFPEIVDVISIALSEALAGSKTAQKALDEAVRGVDKILRR